MRRGVRKVRRQKRKVNRKGKLSSNTKVDVVSVYRTNTALTVTAAVTPSLGFYHYSAYSPQNSQYVTIAQQSEFQSQAKLYDEFNIVKVKYTYRPWANVQTLAAQAPTAPVAFYDINLYTFIDRDGSNPISTSTNATQKVQSYDSCKIYSYNKKWSRVVRKKTFWTDTNFPTMNPASSSGLAQPWINAGAMQVLGLYAERIPLNAVGELLGELITEYTVQFRGKKPALYAYDPVSGSVIVTPTSSYPPLAPSNSPDSLPVVLGDEVITCTEDGIKVLSTIDGQQALVA